MNRLMMTAAIAALITLPGCGDDEIKPGDVVVNWTHGALSSTTCESRGLVKIVATATKADIVERAETPCDDNARSLSLLGLEPGNYRIEVEGFDADGKGTFLGVIEKFGVKEGKAVDTPEITLTEKPARIRVDWTVPEGKCGSSDIKSVSVEIFYDGLGQPTSKGLQEDSCDATYVDPDNADDVLAGMIFEDLQPDPEVVVVVQGLDSSDDVIARVERAPFELVAGDDIDIVVELQYCPGDPPACN